MFRKWIETTLNKLFSKKEHDSFIGLRKGYADFMAHPYFNIDKFRIILPREQLKNMPIRKIDNTELSQLMCAVDFNSFHYYEDAVTLLAREVGHDSRARYILA